MMNVCHGVLSASSIGIKFMNISFTIAIFTTSSIWMGAGLLWGSRFRSAFLPRAPQPQSDQTNEPNRVAFFIVTKITVAGLRNVRVLSKGTAKRFTAQPGKRCSKLSSFLNALFIVAQSLRPKVVQRQYAWWRWWHPPFLLFILNNYHLTGGARLDGFMILWWSSVGACKASTLMEILSDWPLII